MYLDKINIESNKTDIISYQLKGRKDFQGKDCKKLVKRLDLRKMFVYIPLPQDAK